MILRAQTPKGLSWAGRLAVLGTAAFLLPLAPSWGQKSHPDQAQVELDRVADFDHYNAGLTQDRDQPNPPAKRDENAARQPAERQSDEQLEHRIQEEFRKDPEVIALSDDLAAAAEQRDHARSLPLQPNDPARRAAEPRYKKLLDQYQQLWRVKYGELLALRSQDDHKKDSKKDEGAKDDNGRDTAERFEERVKDLIDTLTKELGPVGEELRRILEKSVDEIHQTLKKEGLSADDLRKALENSHDEMRKAFEQGGTIDKELREAWEKSRDDLRAEWERARSDLRMTMRDRLESTRQQERVREGRNDRDQAKESPDKNAVDKDQERAEIDKVHAEVRALQEQLHQANRRLMDLQRCRMQRNARARRSESPLAKPAPERDSNAQPSPRGSGTPSPRAARSPAPPATPAAPRHATPPTDRQPARPVRPPGDERGARGSGGQPQYEQRLQNLDDKLERLLKEIEKLKDEKKPKDSKDSNSRLTRPARPGASVAF